MTLYTIFELEGLQYPVHQIRVPIQAEIFSLFGSHSLFVPGGVEICLTRNLKPEPGAAKLILSPYAAPFAAMFHSQYTKKYHRSARELKRRNYHWRAPPRKYENGRTHQS
jgi:hypothetical protein